MQFLEGVAKPVAGLSPVKHPVRGMQQALMDMLSFYKKIIESYVLDKTTHVAVKGWYGGSKTKLRKNFGGWL